jgi:hypothetical protein
MNAMPGSAPNDVRDADTGPQPLFDRSSSSAGTGAGSRATGHGRWAGRLILVLVLLVLAGVVLWLLALMRLQDVATATGPAVDFGARGNGPEAPAGPAADAGDGPVPGVTPPPAAPAGPDPEWVARVAAATGVPGRALQAYAAADLRTRSEDPACELSWATLAGIGWVESRHGTIQGNTLDADGRPAAGAIIGVPLNGEGPVAAIPDSDGGALDGDTEWDRAVGPHQFIPTTWARYGVDGDGDGTADPQDIDDSSLAAARYLCANGSPLTDAGEWRRAVLTYNASEAYATDVVRATNFYARRSLEG